MQHVTITLPNGTSFQTPAFTDEDGDVWVRNSEGAVVCIWWAANETVPLRIGGARLVGFYVDSNTHLAACIRAAAAALPYGQ